MWPSWAQENKPPLWWHQYSSSLVKCLNAAQAAQGLCVGLMFHPRHRAQEAEWAQRDMAQRQALNEALQGEVQWTEQLRAREQGRRATVRPPSCS